jgi:hypothetical protein
MINISPIGRNATVQERLDYEKYDLQHGIRAKFVGALKEKFPDFGLTFVFPLRLYFSPSLSVSVFLLPSPSYPFPHRSPRIGKPFYPFSSSHSYILSKTNPSLRYSIGGQISFDVFPTGWDKTYCLQHLASEKNISGVEYTTIHFFGDKTAKGGNDHEIFEDPRTTGHAVENPEETIKELKELFGI